MVRVFEEVHKAAFLSDVPVLITGESGTGKQLLAEAIHRLDTKRRAHPFLTVNCSTISGALAESELFGHKKGAFTGASSPAKASSGPLIAAPFCSMRSGTWISPSNPSCSASWRARESYQSERTRRRPWTSGSSPPPIVTSPGCWRQVVFGSIFTSG